MEEVEIQLVGNFVVELVHKILAQGELVSGLPWFSFIYIGEENLCDAIFCVYLFKSESYEVIPSTFLYSLLYNKFVQIFSLLLLNWPDNAKLCVSFGIFLLCHTFIFIEGWFSNFFLIPNYF